MKRFITIDGKEYTVGTITFSEDTVNLLELVADMDGDNKKVCKAIVLGYKVIIDAMVRGGDVKDSNEAKQVFSKVEIEEETIMAFVSSMMGNA